MRHLGAGDDAAKSWNTITPKMVRAILKKFEGLGLNLSFTLVQLVQSVYELNGLAGQFWQKESAQSQSGFRKNSNLL